MKLLKKILPSTQNDKVVFVNQIKAQYKLTVKQYKKGEIIASVKLFARPFGLW